MVVTMASKLQTALRAKYPTPQAALRAMGLDPAILEGPRLACDEAETKRFKPLLRALRADARGTAADAPGQSFEERFPDAARIKIAW